MLTPDEARELSQKYYLAWLKKKQRPQVSVNRRKVHCPHCNSDVGKDNFIKHMRKVHSVRDGKLIRDFLYSSTGFYTSGKQPGTVQGGRPESNRRKH